MKDRGFFEKYVRHRKDPTSFGCVKLLSRLSPTLHYASVDWYFIDQSLVVHSGARFPDHDLIDLLPCTPSEITIGLLKR